MTRRAASGAAGGRQAGQAVRRTPRPDEPTGALGCAGGLGCDRLDDHVALPIRTFVSVRTSTLPSSTRPAAGAALAVTEPGTVQRCRPGEGRWRR